MFVLFTDFGISGPYMGQMKAVLHRNAPKIPIVDLFSDAPVWDVQASAYLLAAYVDGFGTGDVFVCVVDPGVGGERKWGILEVDGKWFVGPDNGLFEIVIRRSKAAKWWQGTWLPEKLSNSFHGRDIFAPVATKIACGGEIPGELRELEEIRRNTWPDDLCKVIYIDHYGNAITGIRAKLLTKKNSLETVGMTIEYAKTFSSVSKEQTFWYENSNGLVEIAVNQARADKKLGLEVGSTVSIL